MFIIIEIEINNLRWEIGVGRRCFAWLKVSLVEVTVAMVSLSGKSTELSSTSTEIGDRRRG